MLHTLTQWLIETIGTLGYPGIFILMTIESSFIPFPSEAVMIPAGYLAFKGTMNLPAAIASGLAGSMAGSYINYYLARWLGLSFIERYGRYVFISKDKLEKAAGFFRKHGEISTFTCRLIPMIRQLVSLPAGLACMNILHFSVYTALGAGLWVTVLTLIGFWVGGNEGLVKEWTQKATFWAIIFCAAVIFVYIKYHKSKKNSAS